MFYTDHIQINTSAVKEFEASQDLLAFMAFNLKTKVVVNRVYFENSENKSLIVIHFTFRGLNWLLQRNVTEDKWGVKEKGKALFTYYTKGDIMCGNFK